MDFGGVANVRVFIFHRTRRKGFVLVTALTTQVGADRMRYSLAKPFPERRINGAFVKNAKESSSQGIQPRAFARLEARTTVVQAEIISSRLVTISLEPRGSGVFVKNAKECSSRGTQPPAYVLLGVGTTLAPAAHMEYR
jgi:hypothetical protein